MAKPSIKSRKRAPAKKPASARKPPSKRGRPRVKIDLDELEKLAALQCTHEDVAAWFGIGIATVKRYLGKVGSKHHTAWQCGLGKGRVSLRRKQMKLADKNAAMAIFLGKQYLGQKDVREVGLRIIDDMNEEELLEILGGEPDPDELRAAARTHPAGHA